LLRWTPGRVGYIRVSTVAQTLDQQNSALAAAGVNKVFSDVMSGARDDRPGLAELLAYVREGVTGVVWKLDRLGRNMLHILQMVKELTDRSHCLGAPRVCGDDPTGNGNVTQIAMCSPRMRG
jgi:DNA invertase Pin-like site-specific DNA recombinase